MTPTFCVFLLLIASGELKAPGKASETMPNSKVQPPSPPGPLLIVTQPRDYGLASLKECYHSKGRGDRLVGAFYMRGEC